MGMNLENLLTQTTACSHTVQQTCTEHPLPTYLYLRSRQSNLGIFTMTTFSSARRRKRRRRRTNDDERSEEHQEEMSTEDRAATKMIIAEDSSKGPINEKNKFKRKKPCMPLLQVIPVLLVGALFKLTAVECLLRISSIDVPAATINGSSVWLSCNYELADEDQLYSVKWYKDYVEFYRFQPSAALAQASDARFEYELDGVHLDLSKSNATHVYLWQVTPHSEATYKCEVSADSPSFKTVSAERQLKVYILPKRKLSIVVNNTSNQNTPVQSTMPMDNAPQSNGPSTLPSSQYSMSHYNLNDMINMTCIMGPSKPTASLRWFINDLSVEPDSPWLTLRHYNDAGQQVSDSAMAYARATFRPVETHLTIAFQLQASHLFMQQHQQQRQRKAFNPHRSNKLSNAGGHWLVQLRCTAHLGVEFASEASIKLADGNTVVKNRRQDSIGLDSSASSRLILPQPSSQVRRVVSDESAPNDRADNRNYRARSSSSSLTRAAQTGAHSFIDFAYKWPPVRSPQVTVSDWSDGAGNNNDRQPPVMLFGPTPGNQRTSSASQLLVVVWTNRQMKAQSDHIEQLLLRTRPNQLEPPIIEASIKASTYKPSDRYQGGGGREGDSVGVELQPGNNETAYLRDWTHLPSSVESSSPGDDGDSEAPGQEEPERDLFEFTCTSRLNSPERDLLRDVRLVWLLNNKPVRGDRVNAFDGSVFYYSEGSSDKHDETKLNDTSGNASNGNVRTTPDQRFPTTIRRRNGQQQQSLAIDQNQNQNDQRRSTLLIDLSPTLMHLKELDLKCRTVVVQPLIEFEAVAQSVVAVSATASSTSLGALPYLPTSPFTHATIDRDASSPGAPSLFNGNNNQQDPSVQAGSGRGRVTNLRAPNGYYQRRNPSLANRNNNSETTNTNTNNNRPAKHWTSVIKLRHQPSASSSSAPHIDPQRLYYTYLGHTLTLTLFLLLRYTYT